MADLLNEFFSSVFTEEGTGPVPQPEPIEEIVRMEKILITEWDVRKKIRKLRAAAAAGPDEIGPRLLKELENEIVGPLTQIFRSSLEKSEVPEDWKRANVAPIFKKGHKADPGNYRPVSLTSVCCKLLESVIRDKMMQYLLNNNLISENQHGFMNNKSCCTNLLEFLERATKAVDDGEPFDVVFLDFAKAFDKVPRERLLAKLKGHGNPWRSHQLDQGLADR
jgi:hypothetical protein